MIMWIRTQNKTKLVPIGNGGFYPEAMQRGIILTNVQGTDVIQSAVYESQERAIEVLDSIEVFINDCHRFKDDNMFEPIFTMPEV